MVTTNNINNHLGNMAKNWTLKASHEQPSARVLYIWDDISEGQYAAVPEVEVRGIKEFFRKISCKTVPKFTVVIVGKRYYICFFPDKNPNSSNKNAADCFCVHKNASPVFSSKEEAKAKVKVDTTTTSSSN
ncbi:hypothetical protein K469DRAFT_689260 [Zopfia rhizophila CBS 207.26]|uniref:Piwi domain-containing protein n=1 Tax=Zopfia rhizophila CBS 207.26 TaxID=1314779 RepID=A0A6A6EVW1_9PEZI|nr:hypothetical protein K469DRAFT_689260 [Zopfia rhizophila CBS 207.26]